MVSEYVSIDSILITVIALHRVLKVSDVTNQI